MVYYTSNILSFIATKNRETEHNYNISSENSADSQRSFYASFIKNSIDDIALSYA